MGTLMHPYPIVIFAYYSAGPLYWNWNRDGPPPGSRFFTPPRGTQAILLWHPVTEG